MEPTNGNNGNHEPILVRSPDQDVPGTTRERIIEAFRIKEALYKDRQCDIYFRAGDFLHPQIDPMQGVFLYHCHKKE